MGSTKSQNKKIKLWGTQFFGFQRVEKNTLESSKNNGLAHIKYNIVFQIIMYYLSTLTSLNQIPL
jgi:hypothetical protein